MQPRYLLIIAIALLLIGGIVYFKSSYHTQAISKNSNADKHPAAELNDSISPVNATVLTID